MLISGVKSKNNTNCCVISGAWCLASSNIVEQHQWLYLKRMFDRDNTEPTFLAGIQRDVEI